MNVIIKVKVIKHILFLRHFWNHMDGSLTRRGGVGLHWNACGKGGFHVVLESDCKQLVCSGVGVILKDNRSLAGGSSVLYFLDKSNRNKVVDVFSTEAFSSSWCSTTTCFETLLKSFHIMNFII